MCELFPIFRRLRMMRNWGGIVDITPDRSPIIGLTPVPGLFVNCGWGTGGFKATPGSGHVFAATIARGEPHPIAAPFTLGPVPHGPPDRRGGGGGGGALMLLIPCPWCGPRPENEFRHGGEAHIARPADPAARRRRRMGRLPLRRGQPEGRARRALAARAWLRAVLQCVRDTVTDRILRQLQAAARATPPRMTRHDVPHPAGGRIDRARTDPLQLRRPRATAASPATRWPRRCSPTACTWSAARSSITGRAASCRRGAEEPNALVTVDRGAGPRSRRTCARPRSSCTRAWWRAARTAGRRLRFDLGALAGLARRCFPAGFYYKTFMWPRGILAPSVRPADPRGRRARPGADRARPGPLSAPLRPLRRAGDRRRPGRAGRRAGRAAAPARASSCAMSRPSRVAHCWPSRGAAIDGMRRSDWLRRRWKRLPAMPSDGAAPHHRVRLVSRTT